MSYTIYKTNYFDKFSCIADRCKNNCCHDWKINLSKTDYNGIKAYRFSPELKQKVNKCISRIKPPINDFFYAYIELEKNNKCPFNNEQGLCELQLETNRGDLIHTCDSYPRVTNSLLFKNSGQNEDNAVEKCCHTSCEAVVELLLSLRTGIKLIEESSNQSEYDVLQYSTKAISGKLIAKRPIINYYYDIRNMCIKVLQNREISVDDRILHLGFFLSEISEAELKNRLDTIPKIIFTCENQLSDYGLFEYLKSIRGNKNYMLMGNSGAVSMLFKQTDYFKEIASNLDIRKHPNGFFFPDESKFDSYLKSFMNIPDMQEYILENVAVNIFLEKMIPLAVTQLNIWQNYCLFCRYYSLLKFCVSAKLKGSQDKQELVQAIAKCAREILHSSENTQCILKELELLKMSNVGDTAVLVKMQ